MYKGRIRSVFKLLHKNIVIAYPENVILESTTKTATSCELEGLINIETLENKYYLHPKCTCICNTSWGEIHEEKQQVMLPKWSINYSQWIEID